MDLSGIGMFSDRRNCISEFNVGAHSKTDDVRAKFETAWSLTTGDILNIYPVLEK